MVLICNSVLVYKNKRGKLYLEGQVQWLKVLITALWEAKASGSPEVTSSRPAQPTWQKPVSIKNTKIRHTPVVSYLGGWGRTIAWAQKLKDASELWLHHCTPAWVTEGDPISNKIEQKNQQYVTNGKNQAFKRKLKFRKHALATASLTASQYLKTF